MIDMTQITFENQNGRKNSRGERLWGVDVRLEGTIVGEIRNVDAFGFQYFPKGQKKGGEIFSRLAEVKSSLLTD